MFCRLRLQLLNGAPVCGESENGRPRGPPIDALLLTDAQLCNDGAITVDVLLCKIVEQAAALTDHHEQATAGMVVVLVLTQVLGQLVDTGGEDGDLDLGGAGVALMGRVLVDDSGFLFLLDHGFFHLSIDSPAAKSGMAECCFQRSPGTGRADVVWRNRQPYHISTVSGESKEKFFGKRSFFCRLYNDV